ncbi:MAG: hypothetical protein CK532_01970 [Flavobacteriales bacterium]|nr:MAG: hypothetical protein CK532_01970 [Flavobacteriales bacterium]
MNVLPPPLTLVGKIHSKHGYDGKLSIECFIPSNSMFTKGNYLFVILDGKGVPFCIEEVNKTKEIIKFAGINNEKSARKLLGLSFGIASESINPSSPAVHHLMGFIIIDTHSGFKGRITDAIDFPQGLMFSVEIAGSTSVFNCAKNENSLQPFHIDLIKTPKVGLKTSVNNPNPLQTILIPYVKEWIIDIDNIERSVTMFLPEGLIGINDSLI